MIWGQIDQGRCLHDVDLCSAEVVQVSMRSIRITPQLMVRS